MASNNDATLIDLSISIVNTSNWEYIKPCLESIINNIHGITYEILVVDNVSTDASVEKIKHYFPDVKLSINETRFGFAKNNNVNIAKATGKYVFLLNDDTLVLPNTIEKALKVFDFDTKIGVVGCKMINTDGTIQRASSRKFRTLLSELINESGLFRLLPQSFIEPISTVMEIDIPSEAGMLIRKETIDDVGPLDEQFFMFGEGPEWCRRIKRAGWKVLYFENCPVIHFGGTTNKRTSVKMYIQFYKSTYLFFTKDSPLKGLIYKQMILLFFLLKRAFKSVYALFEPGYRQQYAELKPYYDGLIEFMISKFDDSNYPFSA